MIPILAQHIANSELAYELSPIEGSSTGTSIRMALTLFSSANAKLDVLFMYRTHGAADWSRDAELECATSDGQNEGTLLGLSSSQTGITHAVEWNFSANGIADGQTCEVRLYIESQPRIFSLGVNSGFDEHVSFQNRNSVGICREHTVVGLNLKGLPLCVGTNSVYGLNEYEQVVDLFAAPSPVFALQKQDGNYIVVTKYGDAIAEYDSTGAAIKHLVNHVFFDGISHVSYNEHTDSLLVAGGIRHYVTEFSWAVDNFGAVLWQHGNGNAGNNYHQVNAPTSAVFNPAKTNLVYVADTNNDRVLFIDRNTNTSVPIASVLIENAQVQLNRPAYLTVLGDKVAVVEQSPEAVAYQATKLSHPSYLRYLAQNAPPAAYDKNAVSAYNNLLFTPLRRMVD